jgi:uncharacterized protein (DUF1786 family)
LAAIPNRILAIDVGSGTQDILLYEEGEPMENCVQMVLPSPTRLVAQKIAAATVLRKSIFLSGNTMGGGPNSWAVEEHLRKGLKVYATETAALSFHDNLDQVRKSGVGITDHPPKRALKIPLRDVDLPALRKAFKPFQISLPPAFAVALQDHGFNPRGSNRRFRFQYWEKFLQSGGNLPDLIYFHPPPYMTRMLAAQKDLPGAAVMDTCAAAVWGVLCDPAVAERQAEGFVALNLGNQHTLGALIQGNRVWGVFEHHTGRMTGEKLKGILERFPGKGVGNDEIFQDQGHGCAYHPGYSRKKGFRFVAVTGPRRSRVEGLGYYMAAPYGNMMLAGCFGLVAALKAKLTAEHTARRSRNQRKNGNYNGPYHQE